VADKDYNFAGYDLYLESGRVQMRIGGTGGTQAAVAGKVPLNVRTHVAGVYTGSQILIYVNGTQVGQTPATGGLSNCSKDIYIGAWGIPGSGRYFQGQIDGIRLYNRALSPSEVRSLATSDQ